MTSSYVRLEDNLIKRSTLAVIIKIKNEIESGLIIGWDYLLPLLKERERFLLTSKNDEFQLELA